MDILISILFSLGILLFLNLLEKFLFKLETVKKRKDEINSTLNYISIALKNELNKSYIKIFILNISDENKIIKLGVTISEEGIIEALTNISPIDIIKLKIKNLLLVFNECSISNYNITVDLLKEENINETNKHLFRQIIPK